MAAVTNQPIEPASKDKGIWGVITLIGGTALAPYAPGVDWNTAREVIGQLRESIAAGTPLIAAVTILRAIRHWKAKQEPTPDRSARSSERKNLIYAEMEAEATKIPPDQSQSDLGPGPDNDYAPPIKQHFRSISKLQRGGFKLPKRS